MFDNLANRCCRKFFSKADFSSVEYVFVTPYLDGRYIKKRVNDADVRYDGIIYPPIERVLPKFAITARNRWMVENSDIIIFYVDKAYGGAYATMEYARRKGKKIINVGSVAV